MRAHMRRTLPPRDHLMPTLQAALLAGLPAPHLQEDLRRAMRVLRGAVRVEM